MAKLIVLGSRETVGPKESAFCQIALSESVLTLCGDRFVIRDETAQRTLGGGVVIHPWPRKHKRRESGLEAKLEALQSSDAAAAARAFLDDALDFAVPVAPLHQFLNRREEDTAAVLEGMAGLRIVTFDGERVYTTDEKWGRLKEGVRSALRDFHAAHPLAAGREMEELRDKLPFRVSPKVFRAFVEQLEQEKAVVRSGNLLGLPDHTIALDGDERRLVERINGLLGAHPLVPPDLPQLERETGVARGRLIELLRVLERDQSIVRVAPDLYFMRESVERVKRECREEFANAAEITPAMFRDRFGTSRKYAIPLLEYLDRQGVTVRIGDARRLKPAHTTAG